MSKPTRTELAKVRAAAKASGKKAVAKMESSKANSKAFAAESARVIQARRGQVARAAKSAGHRPAVLVKTSKTD